MKKIKRNEPCDCGSGKKYKVCHGKLENGLNQQWIIVSVICAIFFLFFFIVSDSNTSTTTDLAPLPSRPVGDMGNQQPTGEAPPGKVWSPEHGHWHDINSNTSSSSLPANNNLKQQPAGEAPPGKVWSPEHGHWHDIQ